ncbi:MAG: tRNA (adenosine(37)-N6)-threonylcarbamoyltransferase complex ATPase subunit type 1 TsaE [Solirubrobacterales bacterium]|jgi:tRNA threonylcarbamoyladenosine biosynthesis protein TsaE|nr:tRNA (adenosine(37)-N6)-threonylcarbamoyltransferase complex ATPase subunit type 1 TsaE [Solirubrobacterales bacterium]
MAGAAPDAPQEFSTSSGVETERAGAAVAAHLAPGDVVLVSGELGAGKTTFVRGALRVLGVRDAVTSPTFVVGHLYEGTRGPLAHLDLYRLTELEDEDPGLLDPYFGPETISFVEWPERAHGSDLVLTTTVAVTLEHAGSDARRILVDWT